MTAIAFFIAIILGLVHVFGTHLTFLEIDPRSGWLSAGAGVTVAFIFLYLLPELSHFRDLLSDHPHFGAIDELTYLLALTGVALFYAMEHLAFHTRRATDETDDSPFGHDYVFWLHMGWYALYNVIIGALLLYGDQTTPRGLATYGLTMAVHFSVVDASMRHHHRHVYRATGRWILAVAVVVGWALAALVPLSMALIAISTAFLAGGMLITAVKDELPSRQKTRLLPFLSGTTAAAVLLTLF